MPPHGAPNLRQLNSPAQQSPHETPMTTTIATAAARDHVRLRLAASQRIDAPFPHWLAKDLLPEPLYRSLRDLETGPPPPSDDSGRRETRNALRVFFDPRHRAEQPAAQVLAEAFQSGVVVGEVEALTGADLAGCFLRIEYCQDTKGFWLEPHKDVPAKRYTLLIYLSDTPGAEAWGTDLLDAEGRLVSRPPARPNSAVAFQPSDRSWHAFDRRPIEGVRKTLIVNYVTADWRAREELAFPDRPVR